MIIKGKYMAEDFVAHSSITINASANKVWDALINPEKIKKYLFGTEAISEWKVGSPITYKGDWEGKHYEDKGKIIEMEPNKLLVTTYWSNMSGKPDVPDNYQNVRYELSEADGKTTLNIVQDGNISKESAEHSEKNWTMVLGGLKDLLEKGE